MSKKKGVVLSLAKYLEKFNEFFPPVSVTQAKEVILEIIEGTSYDKIDEQELSKELQKINPLMLSLLANAYENMGYNSF